VAVTVVPRAQNSYFNQHKTAGCAEGVWIFPHQNGADFVMNSAAEYEAGRLFCGHWDGILGDGWEMVGNAANFMTKNMWIYIWII
jgi:hypothetical protein